MTRRRVRMRSLPCAVIFDSDEQQTRIHNENELLSVGYQIANTRIPQHSIGGGKNESTERKTENVIGHDGMVKMCEN